MAAEQAYVRLHITPLDASLLTAILPPSVLPNARNISYHGLQTFPERSYGYIDLPAMDAERIKKRLNGSILKGSKVQIEAARPKKEKDMPSEEQDTSKQKVSKAKKEKGVKRKRDELSAVDIGERQVKRGWTVPATLAGKEKEKKGAVNKSKYTTAPECLFQTVLPPNVASKATTATAKDVTKPAKRASANAKGKEVTVHEFSKATKYATFLRSSSGSAQKKATAEFVKGKGWVDEDGDVVEAVKGGTKLAPRKPGLDAMDVDGSESESSSDEDVPTRAEKAMESMKADPKLLQEDAVETPVVDSSDDASSSSEDSSSEEEAEPTRSEKAAPEGDEGDSEDSSSSSSSEDEAEENEKTPIPVYSAPKAASPATSSESSSDSDSSTDTSDSETEETEAPIKATSRPQSSSVPPVCLSIKIPPASPTVSTTVHPLEALYKRPKPDASSTPASKPSAPSFSFFGDDAADEEMEASTLQVPLTPFTQRDFESRGMRSAAPTPDTAFANKRFVWPTDDDEDEDEGDDPEPASTPIKGKEVQGKEGGGKGGEESDFQKWFYENRGDTNRAWKKRRKVVAKEKRQRENRKRQERI